MKRLFFILSMLVSIGLHAQVNEICNNGIDDNNDGFVDCFDKSCSTNTLCDGSYIGNDVACQTDPGPATKFTMQLDWESPNRTVNHLNRVSIGDLNRDGVPEVVSINISRSRIFLLNGAGGAEIKNIQVPYSIERDPIIGNIDNDGCAEIFTYGSSNGTWKIYAYDCNLNLLWSSPAGSEPRSNPYYLSLANFDGDDKVELYYKDEVVDAHTGVRIISTTKNLDSNGNVTTRTDWSGNTVDEYVYNLIAAPIAADIVGDSKLELIAGCRIYEVNLGTRTANSGTLTLLDKHDNFKIKSEETSTTSVADYNLDGFLDVLSTGSNYTGTTDRSNMSKNDGHNTTLFFWDVHNGVLKTYIDAFSTSVSVYDCAGGVPGAVTSGTFYSSGWKNGTGRINIADIDGDGKLNAVYVSGKFLYALDENFNQKWRIVVNEETSGWTGCTMFDFNGDGKTEIVYRDEKFVYIIYGDGTISNQQKCISRTNREYPIVADVDADGSTEICVTCAFDDNLSDTDFCNQSNVGLQEFSVVRAYKSASEPWVPARRVWNQHGYFNVNVNDDLSIPKQQQLSHKLFFTGACRPGAPVKAIRPLNSFLNQSPFLDSRGCPQYAAPNVELVGNIDVTHPTCPQKDFAIKFDLTNTGDLSINGDFPITFYKGDPRVAGAVRLNTIYKTLSGFNYGSVVTVNDVVKGDGSNFTLFIVVNDGGTTTPPIKMPNTNFLECTYDYYSANVTPLPVSVTTTATSNIQCVVNPAAANGSVTASIVVSGNNISNQFDFYWSIGATAKAIPADYKGATYTGLAPQTYTVFARHKTASCDSDTKQQVVTTEVAANPTVQLSLETPYTNCKTPNGAIRAVVNGGEPVNNFTYQWWLGNLAYSGSVINVTDVATGLGPNTYVVEVKDKKTSCVGIESLAIPNSTVKPTATVTPQDALCNNPNTGSLTALVPGGPTGFKYKWYKGNSVKPTPDFTADNTPGSVYTLQPAGNYTLVVENKTTNCDSDPVPSVISQTSAPVLNTPTVVANNTSCDVSFPNGAASASVQSPIGTHTYAFAWFKGQNTLPVNAVPSTSSGTTSTATNLAQGIYTVKLTDNTTGCSSKKEVTIDFTVVTPSLILAAIGDLTNCTTPNGSVTVNVTLGSPSDYTFSWYNGTTAVGAPHFTDTDNRLEGLPIGKYTVKAIHNTNRCVTAPITAEVKDNTPVISIVLDAVVTQPPSDCNANNGIMKVDVAAPGNTSGFKIEWYKGVAPFVTPIQPADMNAFSSTAANIKSGLYTVVATNLDNGCTATKAFNLPFLFAHELNLISQVDVDKCNPTTIGRITVELKKTNNSSLGVFSESDYDIELRDGALETDPVLQTINGVDLQLQYTTINTLDPGFYYLVAISNHPATLGCESVPVIVEILKNTTDPVVTASTINTNTNCAGAVSNGSVQLNIDGGAPLTDYSYTWFEGQTTGDPALGTTPGTSTNANGDLAQNLPGGFYTVLVLKTAAAANEGCSAEATFQVFDNPLMMSMTNADLLPVDGQVCPDKFGSASVVGLREDGIAVGTGNYSFDWFDNTMAGLPLGGPLVTADNINNLVPGVYYVKATKASGVGMNCGSSLVEFEILDKTMNSVAVDIAFKNPTRCFKPLDIMGELVATGVGNSTTGYTYNWFDNTSDPLGSVNIGAVTNGTGETAQSLPLGVYTVEVINNSNNCSVRDTYTLDQEVAAINAMVTGLPITFCTFDPALNIKDGAINAAIVSVNNTSYSSLSSEYDYFWSGPQGTFSPNADYNGQQKGNYEVFAVAKNDPGCVSQTVNVTLVEEFVYPVVTATPVMPVSNCDPTIPNGTASASVGGNITDYTFEWYEGIPSVVGGPNFVVGGPEASDLKPAMTPVNTFYSVIAKNRITQCADTTTVQIQYSPKSIPAPVVELISDVTKCIVDGMPYVPNGSLQAVVDRPVDYTFSWTKADDASFASTNQILTDLAEGSYEVTAVDIATHCSAKATGNIGVNRVNPKFDVTAIAATCAVYNEDGSTSDANGFASIFITNSVQIEDITWRQNGTIVGTGPILAEITSSVYEVTVTTSDGCLAQQEVQVGTEIHPFNGISRNNDGMNEIFYINCIDNFEKNNVKIFNRAGTLVYEANGYNNTDIFFDGKSNKGVSVMGTNLPDGTYFYIIDKRDGSKKLAGYLEIVN